MRCVMHLFISGQVLNPRLVIPPYLSPLFCVALSSVSPDLNQRTNRPLVTLHYSRKIPQFQLSSHTIDTRHIRVLRCIFNMFTMTIQPPKMNELHSTFSLSFSDNFHLYRTHVPKYCQSFFEGKSCLDL